METEHAITAIEQLGEAKERKRIILEVQRLFQKQEQLIAAASNEKVIHALKYAAVMLTELSEFIAEPLQNTITCDCGCGQRIPAKGWCSSECDEKCQENNHYEGMGL